MGVTGSALAVGLSWIPIWYLSNRATRMYSNGFDVDFFTKNLLLTVIIGGAFWYLVTPLFIGISRTYGLGIIALTSIVTIIPFILINKPELRLFVGELRKLKKVK